MSTSSNATDAETGERDGPYFTSIHQYNDPLGRFSIRMPGDWTQFELTEDREGVMFSPQSEDPTTYVAVWISQLTEHVVAEDLEVLAEGVAQGLGQLDDVQIETSADDALSNLVRFERIYTFNDGGTTRKRRVWMMYVDTWAMVVVYQGETPTEYEYWLPMGNYCFATFNIPDELWFATDRDLGGKILRGESITDDEEESESSESEVPDESSESDGSERRS
jgi:hypothetical protein